MILKIKFDEQTRSVKFKNGKNTDQLFIIVCDVEQLARKLCMSRASEVIVLEENNLLITAF